MFNNWKTIMLLAIPSLVSFATMTVTGTISLIMVGGLGMTIIAVVGVSNIIMYNAFAIFSGIGHTVNYLVAQNYGAGDMKKGIERTYLAFYLCLVFAGVTASAGWLFATDILRLTGVSAAGVEAGAGYLQLRFYAMSFGIVSFAFHGFLRGIGATRMSMYISLIGSGTMIFLTYALTFGKLGFPELGLFGAGLAVLAGEALQVLVCVFVFYFMLNRQFETRRPVPLNGSELKLLAKESGKLGVQEFSLSLSMYIFTVFVASLGDEALAANEVALNVMSFGFMPAFAFGATATILVGQYIGSGNPYAGRRAGTDTAILGTIFLILLGTVELFFAEPIARLYAPHDPAVYETAAYLIQVSAYLQIFDGLLNFYAGGLRGIGDTTFLLRVSFAVSWGLFVPLAYLFIYVLDMGSLGAWLSLYSFLTVFGLAVMVRFYRTDWMAVRAKEAH
ncbi:multidrug transporter MatE [Paenibacillus darwinianus]|uniref:Probable multidrug resistance protein NorM n=1 Tax=Paenibacillus darwinianus TaxID=1380763 RepID=A0A9W5S3H5_9BACL|nr:MATE family efflux transporter [Paenibacillus darwinianus]EXX91238.1 multidrug transporter MatE [Paenibacillus darwinianus]EXX91855.1 multidrug transporter MatE [Paenibacillus darwinianus]EXX92384.1 multidrug transporter MatE [Paenibacillus darwinianus]